MIKFWIDYIGSRLAVIALGLFLVGVASLVIFCGLVTLGADLGYFVVPFMICVPLAFIISAVTIILCFFSRELFSKHFFKACITLLLSLIPTFMIGGVCFIGVPARQAAEKANTGIYNLRVLGKSLKEYAKKHDGYLPDANNWCDELLADKELGLTLENFCHPRRHDLGLKGECSFAFNKNLGGKRLADIRDDIVLIFEADGDWNLNGGSELFRTRYQDEYDDIAIFFVDGTEANYWFYKDAVRKFKDEGLGRASMYYDQPRWSP